MSSGLIPETSSEIYEHSIHPFGAIWILYHDTPFEDRLLRARATGGTKVCPDDLPKLLLAFYYGIRTELISLVHYDN
jgi:hypothetical protein